MKSTNRKEHGSALTKLQKFLTFIGSILGIITACITIYTFTAKSTVVNTSPSSSISSSSSTNTNTSSAVSPTINIQAPTSSSTETRLYNFCSG
ncbi:hypothetical protein HCC47_06640 [Streptococcus suis]|nr:hypothetical protein [Streptococcus suis]